MQKGLVEGSSAYAEVDGDFDFEVSPVVPINTVRVLSSNRNRVVRFNPFSFLYRVAKRWADIGLCFLFLPILLPLFLIMMLAVRLSSPGPIFYKEKRIGQFGRLFTIWKFRSMYTKEYMRDVLNYKECEKTQMTRRQDQKHVHDPRITPVGRYLRKLSLDELPQLINVLRGEMSLIGPRPVVKKELERYGNYAHYYKLMLPGMTGLWQVSGRNDVTYENRVRMDAEYCKSWSPWLDMLILLRTIPVVLKCTGAY